MSIYAILHRVKESFSYRNHPALGKSMFCSVLLAPAFLAGQTFKLEVLSKSSPPPKAMVLLTWPENHGAAAFNIYRRSAAESTYPEKPVNESAIAMLQDCNAIKALIPPSSMEWKSLARMLQIGEEKNTGKTGKLPGIILKRKGFDPCQLYTIHPDTKNWNIVQMLARKYYKIAAVIGQAYIDDSATSGTTYYYQIKAVIAGHEQILASDAVVTAGVDMPPPAPLNVAALAGDSRAMVTWDSVASTNGYDVYRRTMPVGAWIRVNAMPVMVKMTADLNNDSLSTPAWGFIDYRRWDETTGLPLTHDVEGVAVAGPANKTSYRYRVSARNALDTPGIPSAETASVTPVDKTKPGLPIDLAVTVVGQTLQVSWSKVIKDELGRIEEDGVKGYNLYRATSQSDTAGLKVNSSLILQPVWTTIVEYIDSDPAIISHYGEKEFYYRLRAIDHHNNLGVFSAAASGHVPDIYAPDPPKNTSAEGMQNYIRIYWSPNTEPDLESYLIYRSLCDYGHWSPPAQEGKTGTNCGPFVLLAELTVKEAQDSLAKYGKICYNDPTVPQGSPLCYAYLVKAKDKSQNLSGNWPYPNLGVEIVICQRLRDKTPPPLPIISGMQAQDQAVRLEWIAAPLQDLGAFHIYRAEKQNDPYVWIGGVTVEKPPATPKLLHAPFAPGKPCGCDSIPLTAHSGMKSGSYQDAKVEAKKIYWYKVTAVDQNGNEAKPEKAVPYSTFTFSSTGPQQPVIAVPIAKTAGRCGLEIKWSPPFNADRYLGFVVFRSPDENGLYRQLGPMVQTSSYIDSTVNVHAAYWYKVQGFGSSGQPSQTSLPQKGTTE